MEIARAGNAPEVAKTHRYVVHNDLGDIVHVHETITLKGGTPPSGSPAGAILEIVGQRGLETRGLTVLEVTDQPFEPSIRYRVDTKTKRLSPFEKLVSTAKGFEPTRP